MYHKFSIKGATPNKGAPLCFDTKSHEFLDVFAISQPKMVRFSFCKKPLVDGNAPYLLRAPPKGLPARPAPLLENLRYSSIKAPPHC